MESGCSSFFFCVMRMGMKMAAVSAISLLLLCCSAISSTASKEACNLYAATGANFTVPMASALDPSDALKWKHNGELIFHRKKQAVILEKKKESVSENGSLKLTNVMKSDAGSYTPEVYASNGIKKKGNFEGQHLCVMDRAPKPSVTFVCKTISDVSSVVLTCNVPAKDLQFAWLQNDKVLEKEKGLTLKKPVDPVKTDPISCKVSNLASFTISAPVTHNCTVDTSIFPDTLFGINTWIFVGAGGGVVLVLIIAVIVCCICTKRMKRLRLKEEGELRLAWTNDEQHSHPPDQHHHQHHHPQQQQQPAGHTGPRQQRSRHHGDQQRPRAADHPNARPQASPRRPAQAPRPPGQIDEEQPPPLPQPRKNATLTKRV